jgi:hypothetical protein
LIEPVQRVPRYKLLLGELIKHTESGEKLVQLKEAHAQVGRVAQDINSKLNSFEQANKVRGFERSGRRLCITATTVYLSSIHLSLCLSCDLNFHFTHITSESEK